MADEARELFGSRPRPFTRIADMVRQLLICARPTS
jgi:hypothetical protein